MIGHRRLSRFARGEAAAYRIRDKVNFNNAGSGEPAYKEPAAEQPKTGNLVRVA